MNYKLKKKKGKIVLFQTIIVYYMRVLIRYRLCIAYISLKLISDYSIPY